MIEEAKKLAAEIRFQDDEEIPNTDVFRKGADTIDALVQEIERLKQEQAEPYAGMTLRDYFAAKVMQGLVTGKDGWSDEWAGIAYKIADTMLEARK